MGPGTNHRWRTKELSGAPCARGGDVLVDPVPTSQSHPYIELEAVCQARPLIRDSGYGLLSAADSSGPTFIGCLALVLLEGIATSSPKGVVWHLEALSERPGIKKTIGELT